MDILSGYQPSTLNGFAQQQQQGGGGGFQLDPYAIAMMGQGQGGGASYGDPMLQAAMMGNVAYAAGGKVSQPSLAVVGEGDAPEYVIPMDPKHRARAIKLWKEAGKKLGIKGFAAGGVVSPPNLNHMGTPVCGMPNYAGNGAIRQQPQVSYNWGPTALDTQHFTPSTGNTSLANGPITYHGANAWSQGGGQPGTRVSPTQTNDAVYHPMASGPNYPAGANSLAGPFKPGGTNMMMPGFSQQLPSWYGNPTGTYYQPPGGGPQIRTGGPQQFSPLHPVNQQYSPTSLPAIMSNALSHGRGAPGMARGGIIGAKGVVGWQMPQWMRLLAMQWQNPRAFVQQSPMNYAPYDTGIPSQGAPPPFNPGAGGIGALGSSQGQTRSERYQSDQERMWAALRGQDINNPYNTPQDNTPPIPGQNDWSSADARDEFNRNQEALRNLGGQGTLPFVPAQGPGGYGAAPDPYGVGEIPQMAGGGVIGGMYPTMPAPASSYVNSPGAVPLHLNNGQNAYMNFGPTQVHTGNWMGGGPISTPGQHPFPTMPAPGSSYAPGGVPFHPPGYAGGGMAYMNPFGPTQVHPGGFGGGQGGQVPQQPFQGGYQSVGPQGAMGAVQTQAAPGMGSMSPMTRMGRPTRRMAGGGVLAPHGAPNRVAPTGGGLQTIPGVAPAANYNIGGSLPFPDTSGGTAAGISALGGVYGQNLGGLASGYQNAYQAALGMNQQNYNNILAGYQQAMGNQVAGQQGIQAGYGTLGQNQAQGYGQLSNQVLGMLGIGNGGAVGPGGTANLTGNWGVAQPAATAIGDVYAQQLGAANQGLTSSGLGNTTVKQSVDRGIGLDAAKAYGALGSNLAQTGAGYMGQFGAAGLASGLNTGLAGLNYANQANQQNTAQANQQLGFMNSVNAPYPNAAAYTGLAGQIGQGAQAQQNFAQSQQNQAQQYALQSAGIGLQAQNAQNQAALANQGQQLSYAGQLANANRPPGPNRPPAAIGNPYAAGMGQGGQGIGGAPQPAPWQIAAAQQQPDAQLNQQLGLPPNAVIVRPDGPGPVGGGPQAVPPGGGGDWGPQGGANIPGAPGVTQDTVNKAGGFFQFLQMAQSIGAQWGMAPEDVMQYIQENPDLFFE